MYIDEDTIRFYNPTYGNELETQDFPLDRTYTQIGPNISRFPMLLK